MKSVRTVKELLSNSSNMKSSRYCLVNSVTANNSALVGSRESDGTSYDNEYGGSSTASDDSSVGDGVNGDGGTGSLGLGLIVGDSGGLMAAQEYGKILEAEEIENLATATFSFNLKISEKEQYQADLHGTSFDSVGPGEEVGEPARTNQRRECWNFSVHRTFTIPDTLSNLPGGSGHKLLFLSDLLDFPLLEGPFPPFPLPLPFPSSS